MKAKTTSRKKAGTGEIRQLSPVELLTASDVKLLAEREELKAKLKTLDAHLKPRIELTVKRFGSDVVMIGNTKVQLKETSRSSYSWKAVAYAVASIEEVDAVKDEFAVESAIYSAKIL